MVTEIDWKCLVILQETGSLDSGVPSSYEVTGALAGQIQTNKYTLV